MSRKNGENRVDLLVGPRRHVRNFLVRGRRAVAEVAYLSRPTYRVFPNPACLDLEHHLSLPLHTFRPDGKRIVQTADFLPDVLSFAGKPFSQSPHVEFITAYFHDPEFQYENTRYFQLAQKGRLRVYCKGRREAEARCRRFIYLASRIKRQGYDPERFGGISIVPCLDGSWMVLNGKHRLAILQALEVDEFPVAICPQNEVRAFYSGAVERAWPPQLYRKSLACLESLGQPIASDQEEISRLQKHIKQARLETWANVYHPIPFYEFCGLTTQIKPQAAYRRLAMILSRRKTFEGVRVLDLGCNVGFYSFSLARRGAEVDGIELRKEYVEIARRLARIYNLPVNFVNAPSKPGIEKEYDLALCFSMIQWVIDQHGLEYGKQVLRAVSEHARELLFDVSVNQGKSCLRCPPGSELQHVHEFLESSTSYTEIVHLGDVHPYGWDTRHVFLCREPSASRRTHPSESCWPAGKPRNAQFT